MTQQVLLSIALMLGLAKLAGEMCERYLKQPAVLAEILVGILLGKSLLGWIDGDNITLQQIAEIGAVLLLFEVGLESDLDELFKVGKEALFVAFVGVALPFLFGYLVASGLGQSTIHSIFVGAALTATSVGITARVFTDLEVVRTSEARIVLGAAVADDVIGLIILAAVSGLAATGSLSASAVVKVTATALLFLIGAVVIGFRATAIILKGARAMRTRAAVSSAAVVMCFLLSAAASFAGLAPIVGAFATGIVLAKAEQKVRFEEKVRSIADVFVPVFFVMMGVRMDLHAFHPTFFGISCLLLLVAIIGKVLAGILLPSKNVGRWIVGVGMIPRGEVGLIFASIGLSKGIIDQAFYAAIIFVVVGTTFLTPPLLKFVASRTPERATEPAITTT